MVFTLILAAENGVSPFFEGLSFGVVRFGHKQTPGYSVRVRDLISCKVVEREWREEKE
jgi:hypothetical protein